MDKNEKDETKDITEDEDADTRDVEETQENDDDSVIARLDKLEKMFASMKGSIDSLRDAQSVFVENGATIMEQEDNTPEEDGFKPLSELNLLV